MAEPVKVPSVMKEAAIRYAQRGIPVFPLVPRNKMPLISTKAGGKGVYDATTDLSQVEAWWTRHPQANIGIRTGVVADVLDIDSEEGEAAVRAANGGELPDGPRVKTAKGLHIYMRPTGMGSPTKFWPGLDFRGVGAYCVLPPSVHESGHVYKWVRWEPLQKAPDWLLSALTPQRRERPQSGPTEALEDAQKALDRLTGFVRRAKEGQRNSVLFWASCRVGELVRDGQLNDLAAFAELHDAGCDVGLGPREVEKAIASGFDAARTQRPLATVHASELAI